ncbi:GPI mannosyltransferase I [Plasmodium gaboni]|uniref:GPI mannosyltransferase 1 n=1 Tax=Plasmodium gaboni TaxID=647221 RepID=A0A151LGA2_9APIC|nr:GPI mannosyltransferase I [Plasmodium gaboni]KYN97926.1 GPI mannosyltransferase I [Plasmodium gaboni]
MGNIYKEYKKNEKSVKYFEWLIFCVGIIIRIIIYYYGRWQDKNFNVKFTDIDYYVFSDAAKYILMNKSPYERYTYRYTPLLAYIMIPNFFVHFSFGKILFSFIDILVTILINKIIKIKYPNCKNYIFYTCLWFLNPLVIIISLRGNADVIPCFLIILTIFFIYKKHIFLSSIFYALAVNFKIYTIIYALPFMLYLNKNYLLGQNIFQLNEKEKKKNSILLNTFLYIFRIISKFFVELFKLNYEQFLFAICSSSVFLILNYVFYIIYGYEFLYESYIYHIIRRDHRHNFSLFFYLMYLSVEKNSKVIPLITFVPQIILVALFGFKYARTNLELSMFLQTISFIALNKVCTSQYFIWCIPFLPIILCAITLCKRNILLIISSILFFVLAKLQWLWWAYYLEFQGYNTFLQLFYSSVLFVISEMSICWVFMYIYYKEQKTKTS